jgi:ABC-2 type transport system permease protein
VLRWTLPSRGVLRAEWIRLRSVRSTYVAVVVAVGLGLGVGLLDLASIAHNWATMSAADRAAFDPVGDSFDGFEFGELALGALGVLAISTEYATGLIRTSLTAVPRRGTLFAAKALLLGGLALVLGQACSFASYLLGQAVLAHAHLDTSLGAPGVLRAVSGAGLYLAAVTMIGFGVGALLRHTAGALTCVFALLFLTYPIAETTQSFTSVPDRRLLINVASSLATVHPPTGAEANRAPTPGMALLELLVYLLVFLSLGAWRMSRDA